MNRREFFNTTGAGILAAAAGTAGAASAPPRLRSAICAYSYRNELKSGAMKYDDLVRIAVETGVDGLDLTVYWMPENPADDFLLPLRRLAYRNAVEIYSISIRTELCRPPEQHETEIQTVKKWVDVADRLGAGHIRVFGGTTPKGHTEDQAAGYAASVLARCAEYAGKRGVVLGLENHGGITERAERILEIVNKVDSPWVGINLDTGNFRKDVLRQIEMLIPRAVNVQVKAEMRGEDGIRAPADWDRIVRMLVAGGYRGYLALEYEAAESATTAVPRLSRQLASLVNSFNSSGGTERKA